MARPKERKKEYALMQSNVRETRYLGDAGLQSKQQHSRKKKHRNSTRFSFTHYMWCCQNCKPYMHLSEKKFVRKTMKIGHRFFCTLSLRTIKGTEQKVNKRTIETERTNYFKFKSLA